MMSPWERRVSNVGKSVTDDRGRTQCTGSRLQIAFVSRGVSKGAEQTVVRCVTPDPKLLLLASAWRARAKEILLRAETMNDADARREMREVAASYERLAQ